MGVGEAGTTFDTNFKFTDKHSGASMFIDGEGVLGFDERKRTPLLYGGFRFSKRHCIGFVYWRARRESTLLKCSDATEVPIGDLTLTVGADAKVSLEDRTTLANVTYNRTVLEDDRSRVFAAFGLNVFDLRCTFRAGGDITIDGVPVAEDQHAGVGHRALRLVERRAQQTGQGPGIVCIDEMLDAPNESELIGRNGSASLRGRGHPLP